MTADPDIAVVREQLGFVGGNGAVAALAALDRLEARLRATEKWEAAVQSWRENYQRNDAEKYDALDTAHKAIARAEAAEAELEIEREHNPSRVICPKCQANLPCESCSRYSVLRDELEAAAARLREAVRAWDADLSDACDGPLRDAVRALAAGN